MTEMQKWLQCDAARNHLVREEEAFLRRTITLDETWATTEMQIELLASLRVTTKIESLSVPHQCECYSDFHVRFVMVVS